MKRMFAIAIALAMLLSAAALAEAADYTGLWYLNDITMEGMSVTPSAFGLEITLELREDGSVTYTSNEEVSEGTWMAEDEAVTVTVGDEPLTLALREDSLVSESDGISMVFGKQLAEVEVFAPAMPVAAAAEDYVGSWKAFKINMDGDYIDTVLLGEEITAAIEGTTITMNGFAFTGDVIETAYVDGALAFEAEDPENALYGAVKAQMLEDGTLSLTLSANDSAFELIMNRIEAEE